MEQMIPQPEGCRWMAFYAPGIKPDDPETCTLEGDILTLRDGRSITGVPMEFPENGIAQIHEILNPAPGYCEWVILTGEFELDSPRTLSLGVAADWRLALWINGELICDARIHANGEYPYLPTNHICEFQGIKGRNRIMLAAGNGEAHTVAAGWFRPRTLELLSQPWLQYPDAGSVEVAFCSNYPAPAGVRYRKVGTTEWQVKYDNLTGRIRRDRSFHKIHLKNLCPGAEYEYQALMINERQRFSELPYGEIQHFTCPADDGNFTFAAAGDWQWKNPERIRRMKQFFSRESTQKADFFAFLGDLFWTSDFKEQFIDGFTVPYSELTGSSKPLVMIRGNHELYGCETDNYSMHFISPKTGRTYYSFRRGQVFFLVLDFGDDSPRYEYPSTRAFNDIEPYLEDERTWLEKTIESPECLAAKYRIVLAHGVPRGDTKPYMMKNLLRITDGLLTGSSPRCPIHLWLGGHVHYALRSFPGENRLRAVVPPEKRDPSLKYLGDGTVIPFPVLAVSGPTDANPPELAYSSFLVSVTGEYLEVQSLDAEGQCFDCIRILPDHSVIEMGCIESFRIREL